MLLFSMKNLEVWKINEVVYEIWKFFVWIYSIFGKCFCGECIWFDLGELLIVV